MWGLLGWSGLVVAAPRRGELAGVQAGRRRRSGAWGRGESKRVRGFGFWGFCSARARDKEGRRALQRALHGGITVAAARAALRSAGARGTAGEGTARWQGRWSGSGATRGRQREAEAKLELAGRKPRAAGGRRTAPAARESRERETGEGEKGSICNFQNF